MSLSNWYIHVLDWYKQEQMIIISTQQKLQPFWTQLQKHLLVCVYVPDFRWATKSSPSLGVDAMNYSSALSSG